MQAVWHYRGVPLCQIIKRVAPRRKGELAEEKKYIPRDYGEEKGNKGARRKGRCEQGAWSGGKRTVWTSIFIGILGACGRKKTRKKVLRGDLWGDRALLGDANTSSGDF